MPHTARHTVLQIYEKKLICGSFPGKKHTQETNVQTILHIVNAKRKPTKATPAKQPNKMTSNTIERDAAKAASLLLIGNYK